MWKINIMHVSYTYSLHLRCTHSESPLTPLTNLCVYDIPYRPGDDGRSDPIHYVFTEY